MERMSEFIRNLYKKPSKKRRITDVKKSKKKSRKTKS